MKNKFARATFILMIGGLFTKILGFIIKIIYTRLIGEDGVSLYMLIFPTYSLLITIASLGLPIAISKLVAQKKNSSQKIVFSLTPVMLFLNALIIIIMLFLSPYIAQYLLHQSQVSILLIFCSLTLPFISISSIIKGYFYGKQRMLPHTVSNVGEQLIRLVLIVLVIPYLLTINSTMAVGGLILLNIVSESVSVIIFLLFLPKGFKINKNELKPDLGTIKDVFEQSIPTVSSRLIGNIGFFFEPIILTNVLLFSGYTKEFILREYGVFNGYVLGLLLLPAFFTMAVSSSLIPEISRYAGINNYEMVKRRFKQALNLSIIVGAFISLIIFFFAKELLYLVFNTSSGVEYIKVLTPFFVLFYIEGPLIATLQALGKARICMRITLIGIIIKLLLMSLLSLCHIGLYGLIVAEVVNIIVVVTWNYHYIRKVIFLAK